MHPSPPQSTKPKSEDPDKTIFKFGPLRGRPEFFYEHVPLCPEDPNCFRSTCGYCHPRRDSQNTHWSWVYPLENTQSRVEPTKPARSAVPPLLFGKQFEKMEPSNLARDSSEDHSFMLPNFDFLDSDSHNPWDFTSTDLKYDTDGPSLRKNGSEHSLNRTPRKRRIQSSLRTDALPFLPSQNSSPIKAPDPSKPSPITAVSAPVIQEKLIPDVKPSLITEKKIVEEVIIPQPVGVDAFLRRMEVIKKAAQSSKPTSPTASVPSSISTPQLSTTTVTASVSIESITTTTTIAEPLKVVEAEVKPPSSPPATKISKAKAIPIVPPFKSKITTHTRTEQESLAPILPLRGGSSTSTTVVLESKTSLKKNDSQKSLPLIQPLGEDTQSLDTGLKAPTRTQWFMVLWTFVYSWIMELGQDIKDVLMLLWATIVARLPFFKSSKSTRTKAPSSTSTHHRHHLKKPSAPTKHAKVLRGVKTDNNEGRLRK